MLPEITFLPKSKMPTNVPFSWALDMDYLYGKTTVPDKITSLHKHKTPFMLYLGKWSISLPMLTQESQQAVIAYAINHKLL